MNIEDSYIGSELDIGKIQFNRVSSDFKKDFIEYYNNSLKLAKSTDDLNKANGLSRLGILKRMSLNMDEYSMNSDFESSYYKFLKESEPFTET
ncbi:MAG TPA: hypothetical protein VF941_22555 [Clostridia bacterium]